MRHAALLLAAALALAACGESEAPAELPGRPATAVVLLVLDSVRPDHMGAYGHAPDPMPHTTALARESVVFESAIAASTGTNAALASILTGQYAQNHGVGSLRNLGQQRLAERRVTLAERFRDAGWRTLSAVSLPQLGHALSGLGQGFERRIEPGLQEQDRSAMQTFYAARPELEALLRSGEPVFALLHFADARRDDAALGALAAPFLEHHLRPFAEHHEWLGEILARVARDPDGALDDLGNALRRSRGSPEHAALRRAQYDSQLAYVDLHVGELLALLRDAGRYQSSLVCVVGTHGRLLEEPAPAGPTFSRELVSVPLFVRFPGGGARGPRRSLVQPLDLAPTLAALLALGSADEESDGRDLSPSLTGDASARELALCETSGLERRAAFGPRFQVEEHSIVGAAVYERGLGALVREADLDEAQKARVRALTAALEGFARPEEWLVEVAGGAGYEVAWRFARGWVRGASVEGAASLFEAPRAGGTEIGGRARIESGPAALTVRGSQRCAPLRLDLTYDSGELDAGAIRIGDVPLAAHAMPRLRSPSADDWPAPAGAPAGEPPWSADFAPRGGRWWTLRVLGAGEAVEALLVPYPPEHLDERLEWSAGAEIEVVPAPGRPDVLLVRGVAPLELDVAKAPGRDMALSVALDGVQVDVQRMRYAGKRFDAPGHLSLYLPEWIAGVTDALDRPPGADGFGERGLRILRRGSGTPPEERTGLELEELSFVRWLGAGE